MIAKMQRMEIVCLRSILNDVVAYLQEQGKLHIEDVPMVVDGAPGFLNPVRLTNKQKADSDILEEIEKTLNELIPLMPGRPDDADINRAGVPLRSETYLEWQHRLHLWSRDLRSITRRKLNLQDNIDVLKEYNQMLSRIAPLLDQRKVKLGEGARFVVLKGNVITASLELEKALADALGKDATFIRNRISRNTTVGVILYPDNRDDAVSDILRDVGIAPLDAPDTHLRGLTLEEVFSRLESNITRQRGELQTIQSELTAFSGANAVMMYALRLASRDELAKLRLADNMAGSHMTGVIHGWIPADQADEFTSVLNAKFPGMLSIDALPVESVEPENVPTLLRNPKIFQPFEVLLKLFPPPTYGSVDPSIWVGISFVLFYGFIVGDFFYGLAVILFSYWLSRKFKHVPEVRMAAVCGYYIGISAMVFGVLFGEYFGDLPHKLGWNIHPLWMARSQSAMPLLIISVVVGSIHVVVSMIFGIVLSFKHHHKKHAIEKLGLLAGLFAAGIGILGYGNLWPFTTAPLHILALAFGISCVGMLIWSVGAMAPLQIIEVVSLMSNIMSYSRLMAVGIASMVLADVGNKLAFDSPNIVVGLIIGFSFQSLNIALSLFSPTLHSLRLNYVESFTKFYDPKGMSYKPFRKELTC